MKRIRVAVVMLSLCAYSSLAYRFICDGILADGEARADECGICDGESAARWQNPNLSVVVDDSILPKGLKKSDWNMVVENSFRAWESVSGTSLRFTRLHEEGYRKFGADDNVHEIFWITDKEEWRRLVGSGEFGTLGATLPRYSCGGDLGDKRVIFDADLVLNGLTHINWQLDCHDEDCISIQTTLVHELGHFFGLDHPCLMCSTSIMSARAGYDIIYPTLDDMDGVRALYPSNTMGGFGFPCADDEECDKDHRCITDSTNRYCSKDCSHDRECDFGATCDTIEAGKICSLVDDEQALAKKQGERCNNAPCEEPLICAGASEPNFYCYQPCTNNKDCEPNQMCIDVEADLAVCVTIKTKGEVCDHRNLCDEGLLCVFEDLTSGFCRSQCARSRWTKSRCSKGEICEKIEDREICVPKHVELALDEHSDDFTHKKSDEGLRDPRTKTGFRKTGLGCQSFAPDKNNNIGFFIIALALLALLRRRAW